MKKIAAGSDVEAYCTKCKIVLGPYSCEYGRRKAAPSQVQHLQR